MDSADDRHFLVRTLLPTLTFPPVRVARASWLSLLLTVLAAILPAALVAQSIPTPESVLGHPVGADFELATYEESMAYFQRLDEASDSLSLVEVGRTSNGKPWFMALISSPENLRTIDRHREIAQRLAHPSGLTDEAARQLAEEGKAFVHIDGGLHASEVAGAQHTMELAYNLLSQAGDKKTAEILDSVVLLLWPSLNPDGQNLVANWYESNLGTPYEVAPMVELYQKYIGHDNNRDAYMLNMIESRVVARTWRDWEPQIIYVHHQTAPFPTRIWLPPFAEPIASQTPPLLAREVNTIGMAIAQGLESNGQPGATHMGTGFDAWYPGYIDYLPMLQNIAAFWTETALYRYATPRFYTIDDYPRNRRDLRVESLYASPWKGGWWRLRDAVDYMVTASVSVLDYAAKYKSDLLYNRYQAGRDTIAKYRTEPPYAYFIPADQRDPVAAVEMLRRIAFLGLRVSQLTEDTSFDGIDHAAGTWVLKMDQEFAELARQLLDAQEYPDLRVSENGPLEQPYDAAGWTLNDQMGVRVIAAMKPLDEEFLGRLRPVSGETADWRAAYQVDPLAEETETATEQGRFDSVTGLGFETDSVASAIVPPAGRITGTGRNLLVDPKQNNSFRAVGRALAKGQGTGVGVARSADGRYLLTGISDAEQREWVSDLALQAEATNSSAGAKSPKRVGLYRPWYASMDEGWTRWLFERYELPFTNLNNANLYAGDLNSRFDVIVMADDRAGLIFAGYDKGRVPPRYEGGLGTQGVRALDRFVKSGGTLVCLNRSSLFAIEHLNLPVKNVVADLGRDQFYTSGSLLEAIVDTTHPVMAGMPETAPIFVDSSPVFTSTEGFLGRALAKYPAEGTPLLSGYLLGEEHIQGYAAALDVNHGEGHVVLLGFRPQWRGQPFGTFRVLFNAALYGGEVASGGEGGSDFWAPPTLETPHGAVSENGVAEAPSAHEP